MAQQVYLGLGSNLGNRAEYLQKAREALPPEVCLLCSSRIYETPPWGYTEQPAFLNQVIETQTELEPGDLLAKLKAIESELGRIRNFRFGPRCIDLDILFYGNLIFQSDELVIPHPAIEQRAFVLIPMNELAPDFIHPKLHLSISDLLNKLDDHSVKIYQEE
jgi:2-amino-4-hydroxy-6-hydroxymethyldihydropteridine diphosphokinase